MMPMPPSMQGGAPPMPPGAPGGAPGGLPGGPPAEAPGPDPLAMAMALQAMKKKKVARRGKRSASKPSRRGRAARKR